MGHQLSFDLFSWESSSHHTLDGDQGTAASITIGTVGVYGTDLGDGIWSRCLFGVGYDDAGFYFQLFYVIDFTVPSPF